MQTTGTLGSRVLRRQSKVFDEMYHWASKTFGMLYIRPIKVLNEIENSSRESNKIIQEHKFIEFF